MSDNEHGYGGRGRENDVFTNEGEYSQMDEPPPPEADAVGAGGETRPI